MILTTDELRTFVDTELSDDILSLKLSAIEELIRRHTNNNFQNRAMRCTSEIRNGAIIAPSEYFSEGDTVQITENPLNNGLYVIESGMTLNPVPYDSGKNLITKIVYPADIKMGVVNLMKWDIEHGDKIGVSSETISRHSVTYFNMDGSNSSMGYPASLLGFLKPHMKARF